MRLTKLFTEFFNSEKTGGLLLIICTAVSLLLTNSPIQHSYTHFWLIDINGHSITHWINDGLMSIFFLLVGLELIREIYAGELADIKNALFPVVGAVGGVLVPAGIYFLFNYGSPTQNGVGIPMATDIAFAIGILSLLGSKVPLALKIFLTALAVIDDLCAILVIAIFYSSGISFMYLGISLGIFGLLLLLNRFKVYNLIPYLVGGVIMWYCMLHSGIHASIAGVLLAFSIPFGNRGERSPSYLLQHFLHKPVAFFIVPVFALANTCIVFQHNWVDGLISKPGSGIIIGLVAGKPLGIMIFTGLAVWMGACKIPAGLKWKHIIGAGLLAGIGFTMSIFVTLLAFNDAVNIANARISIIAASIIAGIAGLIWLHFVIKKDRINP